MQYVFNGGTLKCLFAIMLFLSVRSAFSDVAPKKESVTMHGTPAKPYIVTTLDFSEIVNQSVSPPTMLDQHIVTPLHSIPEETVLPPAAPAASDRSTTGISLLPIASPPPTLTYEALPDSYAVGTTTSYIPPDTHGAVGIDKVMVTLNNNVRIQTKSTGEPISTVSLNTFWASTGASSVFDPKIVYDPYNNCWIFAAMSNARSSLSSILVGVSASSDPSGTWYLSRTMVGTVNTWADFPCVGFNKNWIAVSANIFNTGPGSFNSGRLLVFNYPSARAGTLTATSFTNISDVDGGFCLNPAITYSTTQDTLFLASHISSGGATYILSTLTGTPGSPVLTIGANRTNPLGGWVQPSGDILPQAPEPAPGTGTAKVDVGDAYIRSRVVYRNSRVYYSQTVGLPYGGMAHTAVQWVALFTGGNFAEGGRVEDATATSTNGGKWYAYSSLDVNAFGDILLGFSQFSSSQFPSAGYTFKARGDAAGTMREPHIFKAGIDYYHKAFSGSRNRWGDFSNTQVDPVDDYLLWTIQEYSMARVDTGKDSGMWGTWWAKVTPVDPLPIQLAWFTAFSAGTGAVRANWRTISEVNNYGFELEKSTFTADNYQPVPQSFVPGQGTTNSPHDYSFTDTEAQPGIWYYRLKQIDLDGTVHHHDGVRVDLVTSVAGSSLPVTTALEQNFPNPFNPATVIRYQLSVASDVKLAVYDNLGREVALLENERKPAGRYEVMVGGTRLSSGVYIYRLTAGEYVESRKMVLMK
jgi:hypothetical protein